MNYTVRITVLYINICKFRVKCKDDSQKSLKCLMFLQDFPMIQL